MEQKEQNIINQIKLGFEDPIIKIYGLYRNEFIIWVCNNYNIDEEIAKDIFQETILDFNENVKSGKLTHLTSTLKTYLFQIGKFKTINFLKREEKITYLENIQLIKSDEYTDYMDEENKAYTQEQISEAFSKLPKDCKEVLKLYYYKEFDMDSIAREMEYKNANTAKSKKSVCMKKLIQELNKLKMLIL